MTGSSAVIHREIATLSLYSIDANRSLEYTVTRHKSPANQKAPDQSTTRSTGSFSPNTAEHNISPFHHFTISPFHHSYQDGPDEHQGGGAGAAGAHQARLWPRPPPTHKGGNNVKLKKIVTRWRL